MRTDRLFLLAFVIASLTLLTGFQQTGFADEVLAQKQGITVAGDKTQLKYQEASGNPKQKNTKNKYSARNAKKRPIPHAQPRRILDLSIPFKVKASDNAWLKSGKNRFARTDEPGNLFAVDKQKKTRMVDLDGQMLMSQEPEQDKRKSLDGAAIVINLKQ